MPSIRIHAWGGLGSQLFAWALVEDLLVKFPKRRITIVLHNGGVTKRASELDFLAKDFRILTINDFSISNSSGSNNLKKHERPTKDKIKSYLIKFGILGEANFDSEFSALKPWVLVIRGHYSQRAITVPTVGRICERANSLNKNLVNVAMGCKGGLVLHYRLGDLLTLGNKLHTPAEDVANYITEILHKEKSMELEVFSDSPHQAIKMLSLFIPNLQITSPELEIWDSINRMASAKYFVGTSSKISIWTFILRIWNDRNSWNAMPSKQETELGRVYPNYKQLANLYFY